ncbi:Calcium-binding protein [Nostoc sp. DSM 114161]|jgi:Ca2+-binding RTX toxin-like protein|uniref:beta strand repeat-containing protein n=1 Tax=Nostoc sp. DSM 114161 TaxID=3440143 RepID=UPI0040465F98
MATIDGSNFNDNLVGIFDFPFFGIDLADVINGFDGNDSLTGLGTNDTLNGGNGNDTLNGGAGADTMDGGDNDDLYIVDNVGDIATEVFGDALGGVDTVQSSVSYTLSSNLENLTLTGFTSISGTGNFRNNVIDGNSGNNALFGLDGNDTIFGGNGNDTVDGGTGADILDGGDNDDLYIVDSIFDVASEVFGDALGGVDTVQSSVGYTLSDNLENLTLTGFSSINGTGNFRDNLINGNGGNNSLSGLGGNDTIFGGNGNDTVNGGAGADILDGGDNDDLYIVDNIFDVASELFGDALGGVDTVQASVSYTLSDNLENLTLTGSAAINGTGNFRGNVIVGNGANNSLFGLGGNDSINGGSGSDTINGGDGNDTVNGGAGADILDGGDNDDLYIVDNIFDVASEVFGDVLGGVDTVQSSVTYTLSSNLENLTLTGSAGINGTGNSRNNVINGNSANNRLSGLAGNDTIFAGLGNDTVDGGAGADILDGGDNNDLYIVDNVGDVASEVFGDALGGVDTVQSSVTYTLSGNLENLTLTGSAAINGTGNFRNNVINGNSGNNTLSGLDGNDTINGGSGNDTLNGGSGNDTFIGSQGNDSLLGGDGFDTADYSQLGQITLSGVGTVQKAGGLGQDLLFKVEKVIANASATNNTIDASASLPGVFINVNLQTQSLSANNVPGLGVLSFTATNFDNVIGTNANDSITGDGQSNQLFGGNGNDNINGAAGNDNINGGGGNDTLNGGSGNDTFIGSLGNDSINGGDGIDTADYSQLGQITLSGVGTVQKAGGLGQDQLFKVEKVIANASAANNTIDASASLPGVFINVNLQTQSLSANNVPGLGVLSFTATNFDNVIGTNANDSIIGDGQGNQLSGGNGNDNINGGAGNDTITGGNGTDVLTGGSGNDVFDFNSLAESQPGAFRDVINDFVGNGLALGDRIDLSTIDANPFLAGNQAFTFIGANLFTAVGQVSYIGGILRANTDAVFGLESEFEIQLAGAPGLVASDIIL